MQAVLEESQTDFTSLYKVLAVRALRPTPHSDFNVTGSSL